MGPAASPAHPNDQHRQPERLYEELFAHISGDGSTSDVWSTIDPNIGPWTNENGKENCKLAINEVAAGGDNPGGGPGWCARPTGPAATPPSAAPPSAAPPSAARPRRAAPRPTPDRRCSPRAPA